MASNNGNAREWIANGNATLGIELGSTRIKAVLIGRDHTPIASGGYTWENLFEDGIWTYRLEDVWKGIRLSFSTLAAEVKSLYGVEIKRLGGIGISAMMHGYLVFDEKGGQLVPFRTWRNTTTERAAQVLTDALCFNIPQRWSAAHLYQAVLNKESHIESIALCTTLAGYVHKMLTGVNALGVGEASGVFPIDSEKADYDAGLLSVFDGLLAKEGVSWTARDVFPRVLNAGEDAGALTAEGAKLLDPSGVLQPGALFCPPEGDAGTGMVATNSIKQRTGNVSVGTSVFAMIVLEKPLSKVYQEIDIVATPAGRQVAMVHCNTCSSDLDAWVRLFGEALSLFGVQPDKDDLYGRLYTQALAADTDGGGLLAYNYYSGEPITGLEEGRPLFVRTAESRFTLPNFIRTLLFSSMGTLKLGMKILEDENVQLDTLLGHGGLFRTKGVGQRLMASALGVPMAVMESAGEGGAWGIALLAAYRLYRDESESLEDYLDNRVFSGAKGSRVEPNPADAEGFALFMRRYSEGLAIEKAAVEHLR